MGKLAQPFYDFGEFRLDPVNRLLLRRGEPLPLTPKSFDTLLLLVEKGGRLITKDEFLERLWPGTFVGEDTLAQNVSLLRKALNEAGDGQEYIATVPKRGYRFVASVAEVTDESPRLGVEEPAKTASDASGRGVAEARERVTARRLGRPLRIAFLAAGITFGLTALFSYWWLSPTPLPRVIRSVQLTHSGRVEIWGRIVTDGVRLYYLEREGPRWNLVETSAAGGESEPVRAPFENTRILDISPDRTEFLLGSFVIRETEMPLWIMPVAGGSPRRVGEITAGDAIWCPDGERILYVKGSDLYLVGRDGANPRKFAGTSGVPWGMAWSPDKRALRFTLQNPANNSSSLWEVAADGTHLHPLLPGWSNPPAECCGRWTPDGRYFLFSSGRGGADNIWALRETEGLFRRPPPRPVQLTSGPTDFLSGVPSHDGKRLFVLGLQSQIELVRYDAKSRQFPPFLAGTRAWSLSFSRDGEWMAYDSEGNLWRNRVDGSARLQLTFPPLGAHDPRWSPDGKQIAFWTTSSGESPKIYIVSSEGGPPREVVPEWLSRERPDWSPDGGSLVFEVSGNSSILGSRADALYTVNLKTNEIAKLAGSEGLTLPRWSPDGRYLAAVARNQSPLMLFDFQARQWRPLEQGTLLTGLTWSRDGNDLYFQDLLAAGEPVYRLGVSDHRRERVPACEKLLQAGPYRCALAAVDPDGAPVLQLVQGLADIYALDLHLP